MKICDAHLHYGHGEELKRMAESSALRRQFPCYSMVQFDRMDDYEARFQEHQVERSVLVPFVFREVDKERENQLCIDYARAHPGKYFPYAILDETDPGLLSRHAGEIVGLKQHIVLHDTVLTPARKEICAELQTRELIFLLHTHADRRIDYVTELVKNFPRLKIQVAHMGRGKPGDTAFIRQVMEALRPYENVFFDTSTIRQSEMVTMAVNMIGAERLLYGSDFPFFLDKAGKEDIMEEQLRHVLRAGLPEAQQELIFSGNFQRLVTFGKV